MLTRADANQPIGTPHIVDTMIAIDSRVQGARELLPKTVSVATTRHRRHLHVIEMSRRFEDKDGLSEGLQKKGLAIQASDDMWKFTHITARKVAHDALPSEMRF